MVAIAKDESFPSYFTFHENLKPKWPLVLHTSRGSAIPCSTSLSTSRCASCNSSPENTFHDIDLLTTAPFSPRTRKFATAEMTLPPGLNHIDSIDRFGKTRVAPLGSPELEGYDETCSSSDVNDKAATIVLQ